MRHIFFLMDTPATDPRIDLIVQFVSGRADGASLGEIEEAIIPKPQHRTLQFWVSGLVDKGVLKSRGAGRATRYVVPKKRVGETQPTAGNRPAINTAGSPREEQTNATGSSRPQVQPVPTAVTASATRIQSPGWRGAGTAQAPASAKAPESWPRATTTRVPAGTTILAASEPEAAPEPVQESRIDPAIAAQIRRVIPILVRKALNRSGAEENLALEGVRAFHDDTVTIRIFMAEALAELETLTTGTKYQQYGIQPAQWDLWRTWWK
jgi:hypothetical protein